MNEYMLSLDPSSSRCSRQHHLTGTSSGSEVKYLFQVTNNGNWFISFLPLKEECVVGEKGRADILFSDYGFWGDFGITSTGTSFTTWQGYVTRFYLWAPDEAILKPHL